MPTVAEQGVPGFDTAVWWGFLGPKGMDPALVAKIQTGHRRGAQGSERWSTISRRPASFAIGSTPQEFDAYMRAEADKWGPVLKAANIKLQ